MRVDADLVQELRLSKSWSQEELAIACGLNRRTIQRIEATATASLQSLKALAAAFDVEVDEIRLEETRPMKKFEYKTVDIPIKHGVLKNPTPDIESVLNTEADDGWKRVKSWPHRYSAKQIVWLQSWNASAFQ